MIVQPKEMSEEVLYLLDQPSKWLFPFRLPLAMVVHVMST